MSVPRKKVVIASVIVGIGLFLLFRSSTTFEPHGTIPNRPLATRIGEQSARAADSRQRGQLVSSGRQLGAQVQTPSPFDAPPADFQTQASKVVFGMADLPARLNAAPTLRDLRLSVSPTNAAVGEEITVSLRLASDQARLLTALVQLVPTRFLANGASSSDYRGLRQGLRLGCENGGKSCAKRTVLDESWVYGMTTHWRPESLFIDTDDGQLVAHQGDLPSDFLRVEGTSEAPQPPFRLVAAAFVDTTSQGRAIEITLQDPQARAKAYVASFSTQDRANMDSSSGSMASSVVRSQDTRRTFRIALPSSTRGQRVVLHAPSGSVARRPQSWSLVQLVLEDGEHAFRYRPEDESLLAALHWREKDQPQEPEADIYPPLLDDIVFSPNPARAGDRVTVRLLTHDDSRNSVGLADSGGMELLVGRQQRLGVGLVSSRRLDYNDSFMALHRSGADTSQLSGPDAGETEEYTGTFLLPEGIENGSIPVHSVTILDRAGNIAIYSAQANEEQTELYLPAVLGGQRLVIAN